MDVVMGLTVGVLVGGVVCLATSLWLDLQRRRMSDSPGSTTRRSHQKGEWADRI
jgi:hypothetical protein